MSMAIAETRRENLRTLISRRFKGNQSAFARVYSPENPRPSFFNDLLRADSPKSFGEKLARRIEMAAGLQERQLDIPNSPLLLDPKTPDRLSYELHAAIEDASEEERLELWRAWKRTKGPPRRKP